MKPEAQLPTHTSSNITHDMPMTPDSPSNRHGYLSVSESESGIEASMSSMAEEDDDDHQRRSQAMTDQDPPLLQRAMRSAKRSAAQAHHKPLQGGFAQRADDGSSKAPQQPQTLDLDSLPREEQDMVMAGVANATMATEPVVMSTSSSSSIDSIQGTDEQQQSHQYPMQPRNIPIPSSGYDGDSEGTTADTNRPPLSNRSMEHHHHFHHHHHHHHHNHSPSVPSKHRMID